MNNNRSAIVTTAIVIFYFLLALASVPTQRYQYTPKPQPCVKHRPLTYYPVLTQINLSGTYSMKDLPEAQRISPAYFVELLNNLNYGKYKIADGVTPNLNLYITLNTDAYGHYGATISGAVYEGNFSFNMLSNYVTHQKLFQDIAAKVDVFITRGWCSNCPTPCVID